MNDHVIVHMSDFPPTSHVPPKSIDLSSIPAGKGSDYIRVPLQYFEDMRNFDPDTTAVQPLETWRMMVPNGYRI